MSSQEEQSLDAFSQYERREEQAYAMFVKQYQRRYPRPAKPSAIKGFPRLAWVFLLIAVAGSLLAAERTVSVFTEIARLTAGSVYVAYGVGAVAFIVVDVGAISFRYARIYLTYRYADTPPAITDWVSRGAAFALATQLAAQLYGVRGIVSWLPAQVEDVLQLTIALAAALSGMVLAFVTGEILAVLSLQAQHDNRGIMRQYDADMTAWRDGLTVAWNAKRTQYVGALPTTDKPRRADTDKRPVRKTRDERPPSPSVVKALEFLTRYGDPSDLTARKLEALSRINRTACGEALNLYRARLSASMSARANGHGNGHYEEGES